MAPYSSPYIVLNNSLYNPFPPFPTKSQTVIKTYLLISTGMYEEVIARNRPNFGVWA